MKPFFIAAILLLAIGMLGCKKLVEVDAPVTSTNAANVYTTDATASAVLTGIYTKMSAAQFSFFGSISALSMFAGLSSDEFTLFSGVTSIMPVSYYRNALSGNSQNGGGFEVWNFTYPNIFVCNSAIEGLSASATLTPSVKQQLLGEAKFFRAFSYFYLTNLYGDVPLILSSNYKTNSLLPKTTQSKVYQQIIADLKDAENLLGTNYLKADAFSLSTDRVRPTRWAATALLARVYLYTQDFANAEASASIVINNTSLFSLPTLSNAFLKNSAEAIWQLQPVNTGWNTEDARIFVLPATGPSVTYPVYLNSSLLNSFEPGDMRRVNWVGKVVAGNNSYYYPAKYKIATLNSPVNEFETIFRLGEQYLIRAEARAQLGKASALADINVIRNRAGLPDYAGPTDKPSLLTAIMHERQVELFTEWGHRWLDLKRTNTIDSVMTIITPQKGGTWNTNWKLYPLPLTDLIVNPNLVQNTGY